MKVGSPLLITGLWPHMLPLEMVYAQVNASSLNSDTSRILEAPVHERLAQAGPASPLGLGLLQAQILLPKLRCSCFETCQYIDCSSLGTLISMSLFSHCVCFAASALHDMFTLSHLVSVVHSHSVFFKHCLLGWVIHDFTGPY